VFTNSLVFVEGCFWEFTGHNFLAALFVPFYRNDLCSLFSISLQYTGCSNQRWNLDISCMVDIVINNINNMDLLSMWMGTRTSSGILLMDIVKVLSQLDIVKVLSLILAWGSHPHGYGIFVTCSHCSGNIIP